MAAAKNNFVKLEYRILDLIEYNGLKIDAGMKILLSMIYSYEKNRGVFYESVGTIGDRIGRKPEATRKMIAKLADAGMIKFEERGGSSHIYQSQRLDPELMLSIGDKKQKPPSSKPKAKTDPVEPDTPFNDHIQQEEAAECPY